MKRPIVFLAVVFCLLLSSSVFAADAASIHRDSTWISNSNVLSTNIAKGKGGGGVPIGTVIAWPSYSMPTDGQWLECNGQAVDATVYPELATVTGPSVPDYRGMFLRGYGGNSAALGVGQEDAGRNVTGWFGYFAMIFATRYSGGKTSIYNHKDPTEMKAVPLAHGISSSGPMQIGIDASREWGSAHTANEFRPANVAVKYLILAKD